MLEKRLWGASCSPTNPIPRQPGESAGMTKGVPEGEEGGCQCLDGGAASGGR